VRAENAGARTWLLGALALWALVMWALGLFGLGGRIERLPEDPSLLQALPQPPRATAERLGPLPQYAAIGDRPLFSNDRRPQPFFINPEGEGEKETFDFVLTSVLLTPGLEMAIVRSAERGEPLRLKIGEAPEGAAAWTLASIAPRSVVFNGPEGERTLELRVFDGTGGEPPTAVTAAPQPGAGARQPAAPRPQQPQPQPQPQPGQRPAPGNASIPVTTSSSPNPVSVPVPTAPQQSGDQQPSVRAPEDQVEAIRQRIEARRAQLRREAEQQPPPAPEDSP
jgi:general secretion pathway protein N